MCASKCLKYYLFLFANTGLLFFVFIICRYMHNWYHFLITCSIKRLFNGGKCHTRSACSGVTGTGLQVVSLAQVRTGAEAQYFANLFWKPSEKVISFSDNQNCSHLIRGFENIFLHYKPFYITNCEKLTNYGIP